jgi:DNA-binding protein H-NS
MQRPLQKADEHAKGGKSQVKHVNEGTMKIDLSKMNRAELEKLRSSVEVALKDVSQKELKAAREAAEKAVREFGYNINDVFGGMAGGRGRGSGTRGKLPPKYRNPAEPGQTWSGRGRKPAWIKEAEAAGRPLADFEI